MERLPPIPFDEIAAHAAASAHAIVARWLPDGYLDKNDWVARNPTRADRHPGSFRICVKGARAGIWKDFANGDGGRSLISLYTYLTGENSVAAARFVAKLVRHPFGETTPPHKRAE